MPCGALGFTLAWAWVRCRGLPVVVDPRPRRPPATHTKIRRRFRGDNQFRATRIYEVCVRGGGGWENSLEGKACLVGGGRGVVRYGGMAVWRHLTHSLTLPSYALRPGGAWVHYSGPHAVHPAEAASPSLPCLLCSAPLPFCFSRDPDDGRLSRNFLISREKTPPH